MIVVLSRETRAEDRVQYSDLWGKAGELWEPGGRLPDFSFAGYHRGEDPIPDVAVVANIRDFGADGSDDTDDTEAFRRAITETERGAIEIPPGRYVISDVITISKSGIVLRGAGPERTTFFFPRSLEDIDARPTRNSGGTPTSAYSWSGGFVTVRGGMAGDSITNVTAPAKRGEHVLTVAEVDALAVGMEIDLRQRDDADHSLVRSLYVGESGDLANVGGASVELAAKIVAIDGKRITIDRQLPYDVDARWSPQIFRFEPAVTEVGIEGIRFEFPVTPYQGHFTEVGRNAIVVQGSHCWVRNVVIDNCDSGIFVGGRFCTLQGVVLNSDREPDKLDCTGHHGIGLGGADNLLTDFRINQKFIHDITVSTFCSGNVATSGGGVDLAMDHHRRAPFANLFTNIDLGRGTRPWRCGGGSALGRNTAAWATFWNLRSDRPINSPPENFGPDQINVVALPTTQPAVKTADGKWIEPRGEGEFVPADLHAAQLERRLAERAKSPG